MRNFKIASIVIGLIFMIGSFQNCSGDFGGHSGSQNNGYVYEGNPEEIGLPTEKITETVYCHNEAQGTNRVFHAVVRYSEAAGSILSMELNETSRTDQVPSRTKNLPASVFYGYNYNPDSNTGFFGHPITYMELDTEDHSKLLFGRHPAIKNADNVNVIDRTQEVMYELVCTKTI